MAFSKVDSQRRLNLFAEMCTYAGFDYGKGTKYFVVDMNDDGTEFDIVHGIDDGTFIDGYTNIDERGRIFIHKWNENVNPGDRFKITASKGRIHVQLIPKEERS